MCELHSALEGWWHGGADDWEIIDVPIMGFSVMSLDGG
jgi:hypothetical protein